MVVVLPASICAIIPIFRFFQQQTLLPLLSPPSRVDMHPHSVANGAPVRTAHCGNCISPTVMSKSFVSFRHTVSIFFLSNSTALIVGSVHEFACQSLRHGLFPTEPGVLDYPPQCQSLPSIGPHFHRHLVSSATNTAGLNFYNWHNIVHCLFQQFHSFGPSSLLTRLERAIHNGLSGTAFAIEHESVDELGNQFATVDRIREHIPLGNTSFSRHWFSPLLYTDSKAFYLGLLVPYFERPWRLSATPAASSVPLIT